MIGNILSGAVFSLFSALVLTVVTVSIIPMMREIMPVLFLTLSGAGTGISLYYSRGTEKPN
jgi:hypothetical protein